MLPVFDACSICWLPDTFQTPSEIEIVLGAASVSSPLPLRYPVKILAILGSSNGINTQIDRDILSQLANNHPVEIDWLSQNQDGIAIERGDLTKKLRENTYHIIYFGGHSRSQDEVGEIYINGNESLQMQDLHYALRKAVSKGLQLVIFNSCQGLGLAHNLEKLGVPHVIAMREAIPDRAAHRVLQDFVEAFTQQGHTLSNSVREARIQLEDIQDQCPCATLLPILIQDPIAPDLRWPVAPASLPQPWWQRWIKPAAAMILILGLFLWGFLVWPGPQMALEHRMKMDKVALEQRMSMGEKVLIKAYKNTSDKEAGAKAFKSGEYQQASKYFEKARKNSISDPEALIYLNNSKVALVHQDTQRKTVRFVASIPIGDDPRGKKDLKSRTGNLDIAQEILRGIAQGQFDWNDKYKNDQDTPLLEIMIANDENDPKIVRNLAKAISENDNVFAVIGSNSSDTSLAAAPIYQKAKLVMLTPTSFAARITDVDEGKLTDGTYIFKMVPDLGVYAEKLASYIANQSEKPKIAICEDLKAADQESFKKRFMFALYSSRVNGQVINVPCSLPNLDPPRKINETINIFHDKQADGILLVPHVDDIDLALKVAKANRQVSGQPRQPLFLLSSPTLNTEETLKDGKQDVENLTMVVPWFAKTGNSQAVKAKAFWGERVNWRWAEAYDATLTLMDAWGISSNADATILSNRKQLRETLISDSFSFSKGVTGEVKFLPGGDRQPTNNSGTLIQVQRIPGSNSYNFVSLQSEPDLTLVD